MFLVGGAFKNSKWPPQLIPIYLNESILRNTELSFCLIVAKSEPKNILNASRNIILPVLNVIE